MRDDWQSVCELIEDSAKMKNQPRTRKIWAHSMWIAILILWLFATVAALPIYAELLRKPGLVYALLVVCALTWIELAMLFSIYHSVFAIVGVWCAATDADWPRRICKDPVAILYVTMNDFQQEAALSCVKQKYGNYHVFLLDDSTDEAHGRSIDEFHSLFPDKTTVIRRPSRNGFKAGNLNHTIRMIQASFPFFAIVDADTVIPQHFLDEMLQQFVSDKVAFAQARLEIREPLSAFARELSFMQNLYWSRIVPSCSRFGFMMFHGHAAVIRTTAWQAVGGFPEVVAEDLAFSTRTRELGYIGVFVFDVVCKEEHPLNYDAYKVRQLRYARGAAEHTLTDMPSFMRSSVISWFEKFDRLIGNFCLFSSAPFYFSLLCAGLAQFFHPGVYLAFGWRLSVVIAVTVLLPFLPAFLELRRRPALLARYIVASIYVHFSITVATCGDLLRFVFTRENRFTPTGDVKGINKDSGSRPSLLQTLLLLVLIGANLGGINGTEIIVVLCSLAGIIAAINIEWNHPIAMAFRYSLMIVFLFFLLANWPMRFLMASSVVVITNRAVSL